MGEHSYLIVISSDEDRSHEKEQVERMSRRRSESLCSEFDEASEYEMHA